MPKLTRLLVLAALLACSAPAQRIWIIDEFGSGDFTDLPPAVLAASAGDVLQIRPGRYTPASISTGLRILGGPTVRLRSGTFDVRGLPAGETLVLSGFENNSPYNDVSISITQCDGLVHLESIRGWIPLRIVSSRLVSAVECQFRDGPYHNIVVSGNSTQLTLSDCRVNAGNITQSKWISNGTDALYVNGGWVHISNCSLFGGSGLGPRGNGGNGITLNSGECWIGPDTLVLFGWGGNPISGGSFGQQIAIRSGRARIDPQVGVAYVNRLMDIAPVPTVQLNEVSPGSALAPVCRGSEGAPMALIVGLPMTSIPTRWGPLFIDPEKCSALYFGPVIANPASLQLLPGLPAGTTVAVQGIVAPPGEFVLTNPAIRALR